IAILVLALSAGCRARQPQMSAAEAVQRGDDFMLKQQYASAIPVYQLAVKDNPTKGEVRLKLANAHRLAQHWNEAALEAVRAADSLPGNTEAQLIAVEMLNMTGRFVDATDRIQSVLRAGS